MPSVQNLLHELIRFRLDAIALLGVVIGGCIIARRFAAHRGALRELPPRMWLVALAPVALGAVLAEWVAVTLAFPEAGSTMPVALGRLALLGAFGAVSALLLVDSVQLAMLRRNEEWQKPAVPESGASLDHPGEPETGSKGGPATAAGSSEPSAEPARPRILVVDDMEANRAMMEVFLRRNGFEPEVASGGREAIRLVAAKHYDAILMDLQMPDVDGCVATRAIRSREREGQHIPIIALTAAAAMGTRERCLAAGMDEHFTKPFNLEQFKQALHRLIAGRKEKPPGEKPSCDAPRRGA